jgi:hypothetical protein
MNADGHPFGWDVTRVRVVVVVASVLTGSQG